MNLPAKKELTEKQEIFLNKLFDNGGNIAKSVKEAGYSENSRKWLVKSLQKKGGTVKKTYAYGGRIRKAKYKD